jgi:hypothetical protein
VERGACCRVIPCESVNGPFTRYECACRTRQRCDQLNGTFYEGKHVLEVPCGPLNETGKCCYRSLDPYTLICKENWTGELCHTCTRLDENGDCMNTSLAGNSSYSDANRWTAETNPCCSC